MAGQIEALAAAFGRLCVETWHSAQSNTTWTQPPSGGCVLKRGRGDGSRLEWRQPPSGGCVLKPRTVGCQKSVLGQPPSGGCVLKPADEINRFAEVGSRLRAAVC